jgi:DNA (cytosine-5)-methyltransferase 1
VAVLDTLKKEFEKIGYHIQIKLLNSANFGVPQKRERVIILGGFKNTLIKFPDETHSESQDDDKNLKLFNKTKKDWVTVRDAIDDLKNKKEDILFSHIFNNNSSSFIEKIKKTPIGKGLYKNFSDAYFRCHPDKPSKTVKENHGGVFIHYEKDRFLTPRELARLQSFDDKFLFEGNKSQILVQIGNAVPPKLGFALANQAAELL